jgi:hypothetical protein
MPSSVDNILRRADAFRAKHVRSGHYLENDAGEDSGVEYCSRCVKKAAREGDYKHIHSLDPSNDHDGLAHCYACDRLLLGWLTDYGAEEELAAFEEHGFNHRRGRDCWLWSLAMNNFLRGSDEYRRLLAVAGLKPEADGGGAGEPTFVS